MIPLLQINHTYPIFYRPHRHTHAAGMQPRSVDSDEDGKGDRVWLAGVLSRLFASWYESVCTELSFC